MQMCHRIFVLICINLFVCLAYGGVCQDGIKDAGEACDDGNQYAYDGCDPFCQIEDASEDVWLCSSVENALSVCCPTLVHPVSQVKMCTCKDVVQPVETEGFTINPSCTKRDINECHIQGICHAKAICVNYDGRNSSDTYACQCPVGWHGDGVSTCDIHMYETNFKIVDFDVVEVDSSVVIEELRTNTVIPSYVPVERISTDWGPYYDGTLITRRFNGAETGVEIIVTIVSETFDDMNNLTASINMTNLPPEYVVLSVPTSTVLVSGRGVVSTILSGFTVDSVIYVADRNQWDIDCRYVADIPNTLTSPFISKVYYL
jgi:cysteine-rich repeat protein